MGLLLSTPALENAQERSLCRSSFATNNIDQALKALKKKMQREGIFREMKLRGHYEKPSEKRARERAEAIRRYRKLQRKRAQREGPAAEVKAAILQRIPRAAREGRPLCFGAGWSRLLSSRSSKRNCHARECGPPSGVLHIAAKFALRSFFSRSASVTWVARIRGS